MRNNALGGSVDSASTVSGDETVAYRGGGHDGGDTSPAVPTYEGRIDGRGEGTWDGTGRPTLQTNSSSRLYPVLRTEDGTNSVIGDRSTWHSESRESDYDALPDLADDLSIRESPDRPPPSTPPPRKNPIVRIGAPSPRLSDFFEPQDSTTWDETRRNDAGHSFASPPSFPWTPPSASGSRLGSTTSSPRTPGADAPSPTGRAKSHALATNFSRPFSAVGSLRSNSYDSLDGQSARSVESTPSFSPYVDVNASPSPSTLSDYEVIAASTVSNAYEQPGIDSFYEAAFPSSTPTSIPTSPPTPEVTTTPSSPKRNTLKKRASALPASSPSPKPDKGTGGWSSLFRSRSKRTSQDESNVVGNGTAPTSDAPGITLTDDLAPVDLSAIPSTRTSDREQQQREWERANLKPSVAKTVASGYVHNGSPSAPLPGWPGSRGLEALGVVDGRSPVVMTRRSVSDVGPARLEVLGRQSRSNSVYSDYSVYSLPPSADPSPRIDADFESQQLQGMAAGGSSTALNKARAGLKKSQPLLRTKSGKLNTPRIDPQSPDDYLQLGILYHEDGELERAAYHFEQSAKKNGGCGAGMLMYGLSLRHGWGCSVNAPLGFQYLQQAAESVITDLDLLLAGGRVMSEDETSTAAVKSELVIALHELGTSYRFGWGVAKDKKVSLAFFTLAADLGDPDAQSALGFFYQKGWKGACGKDLKISAKYYRLAVAQGLETFGLSWIYKPKYMDSVP